jgi:adenosylhomocysteine nucleosidase
LPSKIKVAVVAALHREVAALVKDWQVCEKQYSGRTFRVFEHGNMVVVCGGIGAEAARRAAEAVIALYSPERIWSAGFAGAADPNLQVGQVLIPRHVIDARDSSSIDTGTGEGILVSFATVASPQQKAKLRDAFNADAVDMEAAAVAKASSARGISFAAVKAISDRSNFDLPPLENFVAADGTFNTLKFALFLIPRLWMWPKVVRLQRSSSLAARALCQCLRGIGFEGDALSQSQSEAVKLDDRR